MIIVEREKNMGYKENKRKYVLKYQKEIYHTIAFHLRKKEDSDIINALSKLPNKSQYIKELIRKDLGLK